MGLANIAMDDAEMMLLKFKAQYNLVPIRVRVDASARQDIELLRAFPVVRIDGQSIQLSTVADLQWYGGPSSIER